jgi:hypothetical protein
MSLRSRLVPFAACLIGACLGAGARAAEGVRPPAWYLGVEGGSTDVHSPWRGDFTLAPAGSAPGSLRLDRGRTFGVFAGRQSGALRTEVEYQRGSFDISALQIGASSSALSAGAHYEALTANAYLVQPLGQTGFGVYGGLGAGWGRVVLPQTSLAASTGSGISWLARAGVEYNFDEQNRAFVQYTRLGLPRPGLDLGRRSADTVSIGYRRLF